MKHDIIKLQRKEVRKMMYMIVETGYNKKTNHFDKRTIKNIVVDYENVVKYFKKIHSSFSEDTTLCYVIPEEGKRNSYREYEGLPTTEKLEKFGPRIKVEMIEDDFILGSYQIIPLKKFKKVLDKPLKP